MSDKGTRRDTTLGSSSRWVVLVDGNFDIHSAKTACSLIRYRRDEVVAAIDRETEGRTVQDVLGFGGDIPIVGDLEAALELEPSRLLVGVAPSGGLLPSEWRPWLCRALEAGVDLYSGMHTPLESDPELAAIARRTRARIVDLRAVPDDLSTPCGLRGTIEVPVVLAVGSDCNCGKMTAMLELQRQARAAGHRYGFAATGQTGVLFGEGLAVDRVISDFVSGASERVTAAAAAGMDLVLVEGQGSLAHPFFSGVTLGLLHGCQPDGMILCHVVGRREIRHCPGLPVPSMERLIEMYEEAASWVEPSPVIGIALATFGLDEEEARAELARVAAATALPVEDPVRFPDGELLAACEALR